MVTRKEVITRGFPMDRGTWARAKKHIEKYGPGGQRKNPSIFKKLTPVNQDIVEEFLNREDVSSPSSCKTTAKGDVIRHLLANKKETFKRFRLDIHFNFPFHVGNA